MLIRMVFGLDVAQLVDVQQQYGQILRETISEIAELRAHQLQSDESTSNWQRGASAHLAALQAEYDRLKGDSDTQPAPAFDWIKGAENHLAGLQTGYDRLQSLLQRQTDQVTRAVARLSLLEARLTDLERADTAIAAAIGRTVSPDPRE
jgi:hypothetical protein